MTSDRAPDAEIGVMEYRELGETGLKVSRLGFGASPLGDVFGTTDPAEGRRAVELAIERGVNFFDVSPYYGLTLAEERLGQALVGKREEIVLATKCGRYGKAQFDFSAPGITAGLDASLRRLRTDHVDLLQAHDVEFGDERQIIEETIPAMRRLQEQGKIRAVGITGYPLRILARIAEAVPVDSILSYCRYNLMVTDMDDVLLPAAKKHGIGLINASPLLMGVLTSEGAPAWHPASAEFQQAGRKIARLCTERGVEVASLALGFCLDHPYVATTLVGMSNPQQVEVNLNTLLTVTDRKLVAETRALAGPLFNHSWPSGRPENHDPA
jgi:L-galactose dehydrogenase